MPNSKNKVILGLIKENPSLSSKEIHDRLKSEIGYSTVKRALSKLIADGLVLTTGKGRGTKYIIGPEYELLYPIDIEAYFEKEIDEREIKHSFSLSLIPNVLGKAKLFTESEYRHLDNLQNEYKKNISGLSASAYKKELERLAIDLSWKSSQIEGNTYSLLETERLLKEKETAKGKTKDEATMLLNHKEALDFIIENPNYVNPLTISCIEDIHSILIKDLGVDRNVRTRRVGISGTNYTPLDNEYQIREALGDMCVLANNRENVFDKALLALLLISYIQPFGDGNKRTVRIISNAMLIGNGFCPISFRPSILLNTKKRCSSFYEQNNMAAFKDIFIGQFEFAVKTYF